VDDTRASTPVHLRSNFSDSGIRSGDEGKFGGVSNVLGAINGEAPIDVRVEFLRGRAADIENCRYSITPASQESRQRCADSACPDKTDFEHIPSQQKTLSTIAERAKVLRHLFAVSVVADPSDVFC